MRNTELSTTTPAALNISGRAWLWVTQLKKNATNFEDTNSLPENHTVSAASIWLKLLYIKDLMIYQNQTLPTDSAEEPNFLMVWDSGDHESFVQGV